MNEIDFERARINHFDEAKKLQDDAIDIGNNIDRIQKRVDDLREQLKKENQEKSANFIDFNK